MPDFDYSGNTNQFHHLIKSVNQDSRRHPTSLNFELNLRTYTSGTTFKVHKAWEYPCAPVTDPIGLDKPSFGHSHELSNSNQPGGAKRDKNGKKLYSNYLSTDPNGVPKYHTIKYRVKNVSELKCLIKQGSN